MVYAVYGNYVDKLEKDAGQIYEYFGKYFIGLQNRTTSTFATLTGENLAKAGVQKSTENLDFAGITEHISSDGAADFAYTP